MLTVGIAELIMDIAISVRVVAEVCFTVIKWKI